MSTQEKKKKGEICFLWEEGGQVSVESEKGEEGFPSPEKKKVVFFPSWGGHRKLT